MYKMRAPVSPGAAPSDSLMIEASHPRESKCKLTTDELLNAEYNMELCRRVSYYLVCWRLGAGRFAFAAVEWEEENTGKLYTSKMAGPLGNRRFFHLMSTSPWNK